MLLCLIQLQMPACETKFIKNQSGVLYKTSVLD